MKKRIYRNMLLLTLVSLFAACSLISVYLYSVVSGMVISDVQDKAVILQQVYGREEQHIQAIDFRSMGVRVTVIDGDGTVQYDNMADAKTLPTHAGREEFREATESGVGEGMRMSDTLGEQLYYYAVRLSDGHVLRLSKSTISILGIVLHAIPFILLIGAVIFLIGNLLASRLTKSIVEPLNAFDPDDEQSEIYDELSPFVRTIAQQKQRIAAQVRDLERRAETINAIIANMDEGFVLLAHEGVILAANASAIRIFGAGEHIIGEHLIKLTRDVELLANANRSLQGERSEMEYHRDERCYKIVFSPSLENGAMILLMDVTEKSKAEQMRREFSANVSHELKTPLTSIYGYAEMMSSGMADEKETPAFAGTIRDEAQRLIALVEDIMMLSELDESKGAAAREPVEMRSLTEDVFGKLSQKAEQMRVRTEVTAAPLTIRANATLMFEMIYNLVDNAIKYNVENGRVAVTIERACEFARVEVADTGVGISPADQQRIFERFYRADKSRSKKTGGTGLGLAIVKHIVSIHRGEIALDSKIGEGTRIRIMLPL